MAEDTPSYLMGPASATNEWIETTEEDERFLPTFQMDASQIQEHLYLGSEENVRDLVWLKVNKITRIVTIMPYPIDPTDAGNVSEALKLWYADHCEALFLEALDTPTQLVPPFVFDHVRKAVDFINSNVAKGKSVVVHCGRGISRSATLVIASLMVKDGMSYRDAFDLTASKRACIYPNVGFQIQLCLFEKLGRDLDAVDAVVAGNDFDIAGELTVSIRKTLENAEEQLENMFDDESLADDAQRWMDFGFFIQNCREYLGHVDIGLPVDLLNRAEDVARKLQNLGEVFEGEGVVTAGRVGRVLAVWQELQAGMARSPEALPRVSEAYVSALDRDLGASSAKRRKTSAG